MPPTVTVSAAQTELREVSGFAEFADGMRRALDAAAGSDLVVLPELCTAGLLTAEPGWRQRPISELRRIAEHTDAYRELFAGLARERRQAILAGSQLVADDGAGRDPALGGRAGPVLNVAHLFTPDGGEHRHAKTHLFPPEAELGCGEGDALPRPVTVAGARVGVAICYEAEIPEVCTALARAGADILLVPSYTVTRAGFYRVRHTAAARCIENQVYAVHCPTVGAPGAPIDAGVGRASVLTPCDAGFPADGVLAEARDDVADVITATLDVELLARARRAGAATTVADRRRRAGLY